MADKQRVLGRPPNSLGGFEQQLSALRSKPEYRRIRGDSNKVTTRPSNRVSFDGVSIPVDIADHPAVSVAGDP